MTCLEVFDIKQNRPFHEESVPKKKGVLDVPTGGNGFQLGRQKDAGGHTLFATPIGLRRDAARHVSVSIGIGIDISIGILAVAMENAR